MLWAAVVLEAQHRIARAVLVLEGLMILRKAIEIAQDLRREEHDVPGRTLGTRMVPGDTIRTSMGPSLV